jgi:hypothetical protein
VQQLIEIQERSEKIMLEVQAEQAILKSQISEIRNLLLKSTDNEEKSSED